MEGNIVVDGVLASCYPNFDHDISHFDMTSLRFPPMIEEILGRAENGFSVFAKVAADLDNRVLKFDQM